jgi:hypothetical protein
MVEAEKSFLDLADKVNLFSKEPVFVNVFGAQESIPRNTFHQPM